MKGQSRKKFNTELCSNKMTFSDCEMAILRNAVDESDKIQSEKMANSDEVIHMIQMLEDFIRKKKCICYGGTAINNLLPKHAQFYNREGEVPDYDFFSPKAIEHAKELSDIYYKAGFKEVEAKAGVHHGTFKVFVNFIHIADITYMNPKIFKSVSEDAIKINDMLYAPPNFLRMGMYLELSRPYGDVSRWEKVLKRLILLNKYYPIRVSKCNELKASPKKTALYYITRDTLIDQGVVFFGGYAAKFFNRQTEDANGVHVSDFDVLSEQPYKCANILMDKLKEMKFKKVSVVLHSAIEEIVPEHAEVKVGSESVAFVYKPIACHNYNEIRIQDKEIKIATIDTMLSFYLAFYYSDDTHFSKDRILCMANFLFDIEQQNRMKQKGVLRRFSMKCIGKQPTLESMRSDKMDKYNELKDKRGTHDYDMWFLQYNPKTQSTKVSTTKAKTKKLRGSIKREVMPESKETTSTPVPESNGYLF
jgi:hypothetical protein